MSENLQSDVKKIIGWIRRSNRSSVTIVGYRIALRSLPLISEIPTSWNYRSETRSRSAILHYIFFRYNELFLRSKNIYSFEGFKYNYIDTNDVLKEIEKAVIPEIISIIRNFLRYIPYNTFRPETEALTYVAAKAQPYSIEYILHDIKLCGEFGAKSLEESALWLGIEHQSHHRMPIQISDIWGKFRKDLYAENSDFDVWIKWYEARLIGQPIDKIEEKIRYAMEEKWFDSGAAAFNAELKRRLREAGKWEAEPTEVEPAVDAEPPSVPEATTGPDWQIDSITGLLSPEPRLIPINEDDRADLMSQLPYLRDCVNDLKRAVGMHQSNSCAIFMPLVEKYDAAIGRAEAALSVDEIWSSGVRLRDAYERLRHDVATDEMPNIAADIGEAFDSVVGLHGPMILSTARGRQLDQRARNHNRTREQELLYKEKAREFAQKVNATNGLVTQNGKLLLRDTAEEAATGPFPERSTAVSEGVTTSLTIKLAKLATFEVTKEIAKLSVIGGATKALSITGLDPASAFLISHQSFMLTLIPVSGELLGWLPAYLRWLEVQVRKIL